MQQYQGLFFKLMRAYTFHEVDREDLLQEMAIQLWRSIPTFRQQSSELTWVYRVCLNTALNWSRKEKRHQQGREDWPSTLVVKEDRDHIFDERLAWLYEQIARLHALDRSLCLLMLDGFRYKEIAQILGI
ncbi:MAG: RNA polymerase sigma factor, partial [Bacteroidota bacterium]